MVEVMLLNRITGRSCGTTILEKMAQRPAPSIRAASYCSAGIACRPARMMIMLYPVQRQVMEAISATRAQPSELSQSIGSIPIIPSIWLAAPPSVASMTRKTSE